MFDGKGESAKLLRAIAHPTRLELLGALSSGEECVCHLTALVGKRQAYVSQHLAALRQAGLIAERKEGLRVYYRICDPRLLPVLHALAPTDVPEPAQQVVANCPCPRCTTNHR